jgi:hypothetical protein
MHECTGGVASAPGASGLPRVNCVSIAGPAESPTSESYSQWQANRRRVYSKIISSIWVRNSMQVETSHY